MRGERNDYEDTERGKRGEKNVVRGSGAKGSEIEG